jgi:hypothetical protein
MRRLRTGWMAFLRVENQFPAGTTQERYHFAAPCHAGDKTGGRRPTVVDIVTYLPFLLLRVRLKECRVRSVNPHHAYSSRLCCLKFHYQKRLTPDTHSCSTRRFSCRTCCPLRQEPLAQGSSRSNGSSYHRACPPIRGQDLDVQTGL